MIDIVHSIAADVAELDPAGKASLDQLEATLRTTLGSEESGAVLLAVATALTHHADAQHRSGSLSAAERDAALELAGELAMVAASWIVS